MDYREAIRIAESLERIADSLEKIVDSLEKIVEKKVEITNGFPSSIRIEDCIGRDEIKVCTCDQKGGTAVIVCPLHG